MADTLAPPNSLEVSSVLHWAAAALAGAVSPDWGEATTAPPVSATAPTTPAATRVRSLWVIVVMVLLPPLAATVRPVSENLEPPDGARQWGAVPAAYGSRVDHVTDLDLPGGGHTSVVGVDGGGAGDPVVVLLPALGVAAGYYGPFAEALAAQGVATLVADFPGQGVSRPLASRRNDFGYAAVSDDVVAATVAVAEERYGARPLVFLGHSFGGQVALVHLATHDSPVRALVLIGSGSPYWRGFPNRLKLLVQTQTLGAVAAVRGHWPGDRLGFGGRQPRTLMREWARFARRGDLSLERRAGVRAVQPDFSSVELPVLAVTLDNDSLAPQGSVDNLAGKLTGARVEHRFVTRPAGEDGPAFDHFTWVRHPGSFAGEVARWAREAVSPR